MEQEIATQVVGLGGSTDFSIIQLFIRADFIVKGVMINREKDPLANLFQSALAELIKSKS